MNCLQNIIRKATLFSMALAVGLTMAMGNAEAARIGGGKSVGMQRQMAPVSKPAPQTAAPAAAKAPGAATPTAQPKRSWMGPIAGLAAGLGLAALASYLGFGEELANIMMIALIAFAVMALIGFLMRKRAGAQQPQMAGAGAPYQGNGNVQDNASQYQATQSTSSATASKLPAGFDVDGFVRNAKVGFIRLQAAHDAGDLADIREFTSPEMFAEIRMDLEQRDQQSGLPQKTDVVSLNAEILDVAEENQRHVVSVRFTGLLREEADAAPVAIDEIWHLTKPVNGQGGWVLAGIQQTQ